MTTRTRPNTDIAKSKNRSILPFSNIVNVPHPTYSGVEITHQCKKISRNLMVETLDPMGRPYYWMHEEVPLEDAEPGSDYAAIRDGKVSITPLRFDQTAYDLIDKLELR